MSAAASPDGQRPRAPEEARRLRPEPRRGKYERARMDHFLDDVLADYEVVSNELSQVRSTLFQLAREVEQYRNAEHRLSKALLLAETAAEERTEKARVEGAEIVEKAREEAAKIVIDARREEERLNADIERLKEVREAYEASFRALLLATVETLDRDVPSEEFVAITADVDPERH